MPRIVSYGIFMKHIGRVYCIFSSQAVILRPIPELVAELLRSQSFMLIFLKPRILPVGYWYLYSILVHFECLWFC